MRERWRRFQRRDPLLAKCLPWWLLLLAPTVLVEQAEGSGWATVSAILSPLTGAMGAVVIGAFSVDRWRVQGAVRQRSERVSQMSRTLRQEHDTIRKALAEVVTRSYSIAAPLMDEAERVPEELLANAIARLPYTPPNLHEEGEPLEVSLGRTFSAIADSAQETMYQRVSGPVPWALAQLHAMWLTPLSWADPDPDARLTRRDDGAEQALRRLIEAAPLLLETCAALGDRLRDLNALDVYQPVREELGGDDVEFDTALLLHHARSAVDHARTLNRLSRLEGEVRKPVDVVDDLLWTLQSLVSAVSQISTLVREQTVKLAEYRDPSGPLKAVTELQDLLLRNADDAGRLLDYHRWERFTETATPPARIPVEGGAKTDNDVSESGAPEDAPSG